MINRKQVRSVCLFDFGRDFSWPHLSEGHLFVIQLESENPSGHLVEFRSIFSVLGHFPEFYELPIVFYNGRSGIGVIPDFGSAGQLVESGMF